MEAETLLPFKGRPSGEVAPTKGWPCGASVVTEVGVFSGISARWWLTVVFNP